MDKIIFPNGKYDILSILFPDGSRIGYDQLLQCSSCEEVFTAFLLFEQHKDWDKRFPGITFNPASTHDFLHRECPKCHGVCRINKIAKAKSRGDNMPNAAEVMEIKLTGEEVAELQKGGDVIATFVGGGEFVEFDDKIKKNPDGTPVKVKKIKVTVSISEGEERTWMPNYTTMKALISKYGQNTEDWEGQKVKIKAKEQIVAGQDKLVLYGTPAE